MNKTYKSNLACTFVMGLGLLFFGVSKAETSASNTLANMAWEQAQKYAMEAITGTNGSGNKVEDSASVMGWFEKPAAKEAKVKSLGDYLNAALIKALESGNVEEAQKIAAVPTQLPENKKAEKSYLYQMMIPVIIQGIKMAIQNLNWKTIQKTVQWFNSMQDHATEADKKQVKALLQSADKKAKSSDPSAVDMLQSLMQGMQ